MTNHSVREIYRRSGAGSIGPAPARSAGSPPKASAERRVTNSEMIPVCGTAGSGAKARASRDGKLTTAERWVRSAVSWATNDIVEGDALLTLARVRTRQGRHNEAARALDRAGGSAPLSAVAGGTQTR